MVNTCFRRCVPSAGRLPCCPFFFIPIFFFSTPAPFFFRVALPLARPAIIVGLSLVLMETLADYGTVQYFGIATFTTGIFRTWFGLGSSAAAAQLSALLMLFIVVLIYLEYLSRKQQRY